METGKIVSKQIEVDSTNDGVANQSTINTQDQDLYITAPAADEGSPNAGGSVIIAAGTAADITNGGYISLASGYSINGTGGAIEMTSGRGVIGGNVSITAEGGDQGGGSIFVTAGSTSIDSFSGGSIRLIPGSSGIGADPGSVIFGPDGGSGEKDFQLLPNTGGVAGIRFNKATNTWEIQSESGGTPVTWSGISYIDPSAVTMITPEGGFAVQMVNKTGESSVKGNIVLIDSGITGLCEVVDPLSQLTYFSSTTITTSNSDLGKLYVNFVNNYPTNTVVNIYKDSARSLLVGSITDTGCAGGVFTITEENSSGLSGTVIIIAGPVANTTDTVVYRGYRQGVVKHTNGLPGKLFGIIYEEGIADGSQIWVVISGRAEVLTSAGASPGSLLFVNSNAATAGYEWTPSSYTSYGVGQALDWCASEGGLVLAALTMHGTARPMA